MTPLSEQLAELSAHAKGAENAFEGASREARDKIEARKNALKAHVVEAKHGLDVKLAEKRARVLGFGRRIRDRLRHRFG